MSASPSPQKKAKVPKATSETKVKVSAAKKVSKPTFQTLVMDAVKALNERNGSTRMKICNYVLDKYQTTQSNKAVSMKVSAALRKCVSDGLLTQGHKPGKPQPLEGSVNGSFKINKEKAKEMEKKSKAAAKTSAKNSAPKKKATTSAAPKKVAKLLVESRKSLGTPMKKRKPAKAATAAAKSPAAKPKPAKKAAAKSKSPAKAKKAAAKTAKKSPTKKKAPKASPAPKAKPALKATASPSPKAVAGKKRGAPKARK